MKAQCQSTLLARLLSAEEATQWRQLGFQVGDDSQDQRSANTAKQILQIHDVADCAGIIYVWDIQRSRRAIKAEKDRKKQRAIEAALA